MAKFCAKCGTIYPDDSVQCPQCGLFLYEDPNLSAPQPPVSAPKEETIHLEDSLGKTLAANTSFEIRRPGRKEPPKTQTEPPKAEPVQQQPERAAGAKRRARPAEPIQPAETIQPAEQSWQTGADSRPEPTRQTEPPQPVETAEKAPEPSAEAAQPKEEPKHDEKAKAYVQMAHQQIRIDQNGGESIQADHWDGKPRETLNRLNESPYACDMLRGIGVLYRVVGWIMVALGVLLAISSGALSGLTRDLYYTLGFNVSGLLLPMAAAVLGGGLSSVAQGNMIAVMCCTNENLCIGGAKKEAPIKLLNICAVIYQIGGALILIASIFGAMEIHFPLLILPGAIFAVFVFAQGEKIHLLIDTNQKSSRLTTR